MRAIIAVMAAGLGVGAAGDAPAAPSIQIRAAVARVVVIPEARADIEVTVIRRNERLPLTVTRGVRVIVQGNVAHRVRGCRAILGKPTVTVRGLGDITYDKMPQLGVNTPMDLKIAPGEAALLSRCGPRWWAQAPCTHRRSPET